MIQFILRNSLHISCLIALFSLGVNCDGSGRHLLAVGTTDLLQSCGGGSSQCPVTIWLTVGGAAGNVEYNNHVSSVNDLNVNNEAQTLGKRFWQFDMESSKTVSQISMLFGSQALSSTRANGGKLYIGDTWATAFLCKTFDTTVTAWPSFYNNMDCNGKSGRYIWVETTTDWFHMNEVKAYNYVTCGANSYDNGTACFSCPSFSTSPSASLGADKCTCNSGYIGSGTAPSRSCPLDQNALSTLCNADSVNKLKNTRVDNTARDVVMNAYEGLGNTGTEISWPVFKASLCLGSNACLDGNIANGVSIYLDLTDAQVLGNFYYYCGQGCNDFKIYTAVSLSGLNLATATPVVTIPTVTNPGGGLYQYISQTNGVYARYMILHFPRVGGYVTVGAFSMNFFGYTTKTCTICPENNYCPTQNEKYACSSNFVSNSGSTLASSCIKPEITVNFSISEVSGSLSNAQFSAGLPSNVQVQTISDVQVAVAQTCPSGYYCPTDTTTPTPCPAGTYFSGTNANNVNQCVDCPAGNYCPQASVNPTNCAAGTYRGGTKGVAQSSCTDCPTGNYCPIQSINPTNCSAGTYLSFTKAIAAENCSACPAGQFCPIATTTPTNCAAGTYRGTTGAAAQSDCSACITGNYCPLGAVNPTNCSAGTYRATTSGTSAASCDQCLLAQYCLIATTTPIDCPNATYRNTTGAAAVTDCATCPANNYCAQKTTNPFPCPANTVSPAGSNTILQCRCVQGFTCTYTKTITATVTLNTTYSAFDQDVGGVRTAFQAAVAAAAGVPFNRVSILGFAARSSNRRRMLSIFSGPETDSALVVHAKVHGGERLHELESHLKKHSESLHIAHEWKENHGLSVIPE